MNSNLLSILLFFLIITTQSQEKLRPNILFIAIDDLKPTLGIYGDTLAITPNIDALAQRGTIFFNNHAQQAICGPSRASLLTGKRPDFTMVRDLKTKMRDVHPTILTLPQHLKENGYLTIGVGKIFDPRCVDKDRDKPSWSIPYIMERELRFPQEYGYPALSFYQSTDIKTNIYKLRREAKDKGVRNINKYVRDRYKPPFEKADVPDDAYVDGAIANKGIQILDTINVNATKPFFLAIGFKRPHLPFVAPKKYWNLYNKESITTSSYQKKSKNAVNISYHKSGEMQSYKSPEINYELNDEGLLKLDEELQKKLIHGYYASTSYVDAQIGKIVDKLKQKKLDKNTIIVIWGDHGWHLGDHSLWNKHSNFEQATRSPLIIYDPRIDKGYSVNSPTEFVDVFPTLSDLVNIDVPKNLDGISLKSFINGEKNTKKIYAVSQYPRGKKTGYSFRTDRYRYTVWINNKKSTDTIFIEDIHAEELYDYLLDPNETENKISQPKYQTTKKIFQNLAAKYFRSQLKSGLITVKKEKSKKLKIGATLNHYELNTIKKSLFLKDFKYLTPANAAKQSRIHPKPNVWSWTRIEDFIRFSNKYNLEVRLHGPISPQASKWAKEDHRTKEELQTNMIEFATAFAKRFNDEPSVRWMDVVNETILPNGEWFGPRTGTNKWENPWLKIGLDENGFPLYIVKSFEIANKYAPKLKFVYNQNAGMQSLMWDKVKETILYIRSKGLRVDAIGWQAHILLSKTTGDFITNTDKELQKLSNLIDWSHQNNLEFHITELDYFIEDNNNLDEEYKKQAEIYRKIIEVLEQKTKTGVVTLNLWNLGTRTKKGKEGAFHSIYDSDFKPTPAYNTIKKAL